MEPYKFGGGFPPVRQTYVAADRRLESIADIVMKVVMLCSLRVFSKMYFWRCRVAASQPPSFMTGNLISRRMEVFRVSDSNKLRESLWGAQTQSAASFFLSAVQHLRDQYADIWSQYKSFISYSKDTEDERIPQVFLLCQKEPLHCTVWPEKFFCPKFVFFGQISV